MTLNPSQRPTLADVLAHPWMQGPVPTASEIKHDFANRKHIVDTEAHNERELKRQQRIEAAAARRTRRGTGTGEEEDEVENPREAWEALEIPEYGPEFVQDYTQFFMSSDPLDYFEDFIKFLKVSKVPARISGSTLRVKFQTSLGQGAEESKEQSVDAKVDVQILKVGN